MCSPTRWGAGPAGAAAAPSREIEIWFTERDGRYYVIAEHGERAQWVRNLVADSSVQVHVAGRTFTARARVVDAGPEAGLVAAVRALAEAKYGWGEGLIVELDATG